MEDTEEDFGSDCDQGEFDMDNFMTLDEVGEVEDELEETGGKEQDENKAEDTEKDNKAPSADTDKDIKSESEQKEGDKEKTGESGESVSAPTEGDSKPVVEEAPKPKLEIKIEPDTPYGELLAPK